MFEVGWSEMLVIAVVMIVVVGPKDLPNMLRTFGRMTAKLRAMAGDFQKQFNDALKEAELDDVKKSVDALRGLNPAAEIKKQLNPFEKAAADVRSGLDNVMKPKPAEPLKGGDVETPVVGGPDTMPAEPTFPAMTDDAVVAAPATVAPAKVAAAKPASAKATTSKVASARSTPAKAKSTPAKVAPAKAAPAKSTPAKSVAAPAAAAKKPAAAKKKTAGTAK